MKSDHPCPACSIQLDWIPLQGHPGMYRLYCGSVNCNDPICGAGVEVNTRWGLDVNDANRALVLLFEKMKGKAA